MTALYEPADGGRARLAPAPSRRVPPIQNDPLLIVTPEVLARHNARVLDPTTAVLVAGQSPIQTTVYIGNKLIVSGRADAATLDALDQAAAANGVVVVREPLRTTRHDRLTDIARSVDHPEAAVLFPVVVDLVPAPGGAVTVDAWSVLQSFRTILGGNTAAQRQVGLDHLLTAAPHVLGSPFNPTGSTPTSSYGRPGSGGRMPVTWRGPMPARDPGRSDRRPVVAVLDTGCGQHEWFDGVVGRNAAFNGTPLGLHDPGDDPEVTGVIYDPLEGELDSDAGHGTFIAGLIRQACAEADILAIRVMASDGAVAEHLLVESLTLLALRQQAAQSSGDATGIVDVVSLSLGYYHEQAGDAAADHPLLEPLTALGRLGVALAVAAGNDATSRAMFPAAFYPHPGGEVTSFDPAALPIISVGARNPNGSIALFSNAGKWVTCFRSGANLVSTFPPFNGSEEPTNRWGERATIDPDDYSSGFGVWSGSSFAAPLLAGELAQALVESGSLSTLDRAASVTRGWAAITTTTEVAVP
jgi:hypothetical protein